MPNPHPSNDTPEVEAARKIFAAINRDDIPAVLAFFDPEIERIEPAGLPSAGIYRGHADVSAHFTQARATWAEGSCSPEAYFVAGNKVVVFVHVHVRLKDKPDWIEGRIAEVFTFRDGKVIEMRVIIERDEALAEAGA